MTAALLINPEDNVATAITNLKKGDIVSIKAKEGEVYVQILQEIPAGHKFAVKNIGKGEPVIKFGEIIGLATCEIHPGEHAHVHNIEGLRGRGDKK